MGKIAGFPPKSCATENFTNPTSNDVLRDSTFVYGKNSNDVHINLTARLRDSKLNKKELVANPGTSELQFLRGLTMFIDVVIDVVY